MTVDIRKSIEAKSDRLNAGDLIGKEITVRIEKVTEGSAESPVAVYYEGCNGKPWYPAKTMRRAIVAAWGDVGNDWVGKSVTLFRDPEVIYGGVKVGGVRISAFSDIPNDLTLMLTEKRGKKSKFEFKKLVVKEAPKAADITEQLPGAITAIRGAKTEAALEKMLAHAKFVSLRDALGDRASELDAAVSEKRAEFAPVPSSEPENANTSDERVNDSDDF